MIGMCISDYNLVVLISDTLQIHTNDVLAKFDDLIAKMIDCPPNLTRRPYSKKSDPKDQQEIGIPIRVLRGYYPGTPIFFKIVVTDFQSLGARHPRYRAKVMPYRVRKSTTRHFNTAELREQVAEKELLGSYTATVDFGLPKRRPRVMTPKGMKPLKLKLSKKK